MPTIAAGINKQLRYAKEVTWNVAPAAAGTSQLLRRVSMDIDVEKDTYASAELRPDFQLADFRHGIRKSKGTLKGELSPKTFADFFAAALRRDFTAGVSIAGASITIAGAAPSWTLTRAAGSYLTDGFKVGDVIMLSVGVFNAANISKNLIITALTATVATVSTLNGSALVNEGPIASATVSVVGKKTFTPASGQVDRSFSFEYWFSDTLLDELYTGVKINKINVNLPATGMATVDFDLMGPGSMAPGVAAYFTVPTAATSTGVVAAVNGLLYVNGLPISTCTQLQFTIDGQYSGDPVVGSNTMPAIFPGRVVVTGSFSAYFDSATFRDAFLNESVLSIVSTLTCDNTASSQFINFVLPALKLSDAQRTDGDKGILVQAKFQALYNVNGGAGTSSEQTTLSIQDSAA